MEPEYTLRDHCLGISELLATAVFALSVAGVWYYCYYLLAPWVWSRNIPFQPADITPWIREWTDEHDGVEIYALYVLVFANIFGTFALSGFIGLITGKWLRRIVIVLCVAVTCVYCATVGFSPPMNTLQDRPLSVAVMNSLDILAVVFYMVALLYYLNGRSPRWALAVAALVLAPVCFVATSPIAWIDYTYIFAPALRLLKGAPISDIYFQYDLLPSLLAAGWMKLGLDLNAFQVLGQAAYYIVIMGIFIFSGKLFQNKELSIFLLAALVLGRIYASEWDVVVKFQVTPLRLDLWFPLLVVVYRRGPYHWSAGLVCGLLILLLKNFGMIYSIAYIQLLLTLLAISYIDGEKRGLVRSLVDFGKRCAVPVLIIAGFSVASYLLFRNEEWGNYAGYYQKIGIGFIRIAAESFYWYVPAMMSLVVILLFRLRNCVFSTYLTTGFLLTYCAIGNSIYFFGRSHEHNILNISIVLLFLFFLMLDLITRFLNEGVGKDSPFLFLNRHGVVVMAAAMIVALSVSYSNNILTKTATQIRNIENAQAIYPPWVDRRFLQNSINGIRTVTRNSSKVYFVNKSDFELYYYGGYEPVGYCNPFKTWIFNGDLNRFLQKLLDSGYFLVCSPDMKYLLADLRHNFESVVGDSVVAARLTNCIPQQRLSGK